MKVIQGNNLTKSYGKIKALDHDVNRSNELFDRHFCSDPHALYSTLPSRLGWVGES
ncbi:hypothetical protein [Desulfosporosinus sp. SB140]|uniref:hypothetical protein n=1 Tax=Desulfosporosinus paludis TaxID=3115649 RepID=UPI00388EAF58